MTESGQSEREKNVDHAEREQHRHRGRHLPQSQIPYSRVAGTGRGRASPGLDELARCVRRPRRRGAVDCVWRLIISPFVGHLCHDRWSRHRSEIATEEHLHHRNGQCSGQNHKDCIGEHPTSRAAACSRTEPLQPGFDPAVQVSHVDGCEQSKYVSKRTPNEGSECDHRQHWHHRDHQDRRRIGVGQVSTYRGQTADSCLDHPWPSTTTPYDVANSASPPSKPCHTERTRQRPARV